MFDPYRQWLDIAGDERPLTHYQLLDLSPDETDRRVIEEAVLQRSLVVRAFQIGAHASDSQRLLTEIHHAGAVLLDSGKRSAYDAGLGRRSMAPSVAATGVALAPANTRLTVPMARPVPLPSATPAPAPAPAPTPARELAVPKGTRSKVPLRWIAGGSLVVILVIALGRIATAPRPVEAAKANVPPAVPAALAKPFRVEPKADLPAGPKEDRPQPIVFKESGLIEPEELYGRTEGEQYLGLAVSPDGRMAIRGGNRDTQLIYLQTLKETRLKIKPAPLYRFSPDGTRIASGFSDIQIHSIDGSPIASLQATLLAPDAVNDMAFSPDNKRLATCSAGTPTIVNGSPVKNMDVFLWDATNGKLLWAGSGHTAAIDSVAFAADGAVVSSGGDGVRTWDAQTGHQLSHVPIPFQFSRLSGDGKMVFGGRPYLTAWNVAEAKLARNLTLATVWSGTNAASFNGRLFLQSGRFGGHEETALWDMHTGAKLWHTPIFSQDVALSRDGLVALFQDADGRLYRRIHRPGAEP